MDGIGGGKSEIDFEAGLGLLLDPIAGLLRLMDSGARGERLLQFETEFSPILGGSAPEELGQLPSFRADRNDRKRVVGRIERGMDEEIGNRG